MENEHISEELDGWVEIQSPNPSNRAQLYKNIVDSEIIITREVFPGENQLSDQVQHRFGPSSSSSSLSCAAGTDDATGESEEDGEVKDTSASRMSLGFGCLKYRIIEVASRMRNYAVSNSRILCLVTSATTGLGVLMFILFLYLKVHRRRHRQMKLENNQHIPIQLIKEKDQKISELLLQIAQLNDMLLQRRRVPVLRVS